MGAVVMPAVLPLSVAALDAFVGLGIEKICPLKFGKKGDEHNHCAHFVSHVLKLNADCGFGLTCAGMTSAGKKHGQAGACIRVHNIYNNCYDLNDPAAGGCLAYFTRK